MTTSDHPHARGENCGVGSGDEGLNGPSPRAWGEPAMASPIHLPARTIPTRVGRTRAGAAEVRDTADHPHARGENQTENGQRVPMSGPSPRAWGEQMTALAQFVTTRTIPTRVGRTHVAVARAVHIPDHPHARGENRCGAGNTSREYGPSPRAWGEQAAECAACRANRTIPTRVGRTTVRTGGACFQSDHPHARGENSQIQKNKTSSSGPSPRAWGELARHQHPN